MPKIILLLLFTLLAPFSLLAQPAELRDYCQQLNDLNTQVTNGTVTRKAAVARFQILIKQINAGSNIKSNTQWVFPLAGYKSNAIGGTKGNGYSDKGYQYLDGNKHTAHPAHDIFINDRNQNGIDDKTQQPVNVLAVTDGIVVACSNEWDEQSALRGGKYIWLYHPQLNIATYYAHNRSIFVKPSDVIKQGQKIAEVGRTGLNAFKKRSPTHLHFSAFWVTTAVPMPFNPYTNLVQASQL